LNRDGDPEPPIEDQTAEFEVQNLFQAIDIIYNLKTE
jgi:hypothetical protein